jgi:anhydro-N-acetylmuramic acid kinase
MGKAMVVAGVMSGTSADGVDVAVCRISPATREGGVPRVKVLGHSGFGYSKALRRAVLGAMDASVISVRELARLSWRLGEVYADCVVKACAEVGVETSAVALSRDTPPFAMKPQRVGHPGSGAGSGLRLGLVGCHGQTVFHQGVSAKFLEKDVRCTWQMGEASVIAERLRVPVVSDFRPADLAAGGQGAPLVPVLDFVMFRSEKVNRVLQNLGGMGNLTAIPAGAGVDGLMAFDTGPGNVVIDACVARLFGRAFDRGGGMW